MGKGCVLAFAGLIFVFFEKGVCFSPFHSVQDCSLQALHAIYASKQVKSLITARQLNVIGLKTATGGKQPFGYYKHALTEGLNSSFCGKFEPGDCRIVIILRPVCVCVFFFSLILNASNCCYFCLLQLPPTLSPNPQRRIVEQFKRALFSPQNSYFVNLKSEVKKVSLFFFFTSKCFAK